MDGRKGANHERWLLSYADFVTLMFALFVSLYAVSIRDRRSNTRVAESMRKAVEHREFVEVTSSIEELLGWKQVGTSLLSASHPIRTLFDLVTAQLSEAAVAKFVRVKDSPVGLTIALQESCFPSGSGIIRAEAYPAIQDVARVLTQIPNAIRIEGHTDSVPINTTQFRDNWELSCMRSIAVLRILCAQRGVRPDRFSVAGHADTAPVQTNSSESGRAHNRRVDVIIVDGRHPRAGISEIDSSDAGSAISRTVF